MRDQKLYLTDILDAIQNITDFIVDIDHDQFIDDKKTQSAVIHQFEIIGEAVSHIGHNSVSSFRISNGKTFPECETFSSTNISELMLSWFGIPFRLICRILNQLLKS